MGGITRMNRCDRFIKAFGEKIEAVSPLQKGDWVEVVSVSTGMDEGDDVVRTYITVRNKRTGDEQVLSGDDILYDPESFMDDGSNVDRIVTATYQGDFGDDEKVKIHRDQMISELKKADLIDQNYQEETT